ncbi:UNVERIFIED_ORG: hypothetical protein ABIB19_002336 [Arthrobacter sp. UYEF10]
MSIKAVHLRLRQLVRAFLLDRVLGGQHQKRGGQPVFLSPDGGLPLLHGLQHGALGLGAGPVDLIEQDDVGVHRPELGNAGALGGFVDLRAHDVAGEQVRRALDPANSALTASATVCAAVVFASHGTLSGRMCPPDIRPTSRYSRSRVWPTTLASKLREMLATTCCARASSAGSIRAGAVV